jgi:hypothetical protein
MITTLLIPVLLKFCLPPDVETTEQSPSYKLSYHQLFRCTIYPLSRISLFHLTVPALLVASPACSLIYCLVRPSQRGRPFS